MTDRIHSRNNVNERHWNQAEEQRNSELEKTKKKRSATPYSDMMDTIGPIMIFVCGSTMWSFPAIGYFEKHKLRSRGGGSLWQSLRAPALDYGTVLPGPLVNYDERIRIHSFNVKFDSRSQL